MPQSRQADTPVVSTDYDKRSVQRTPFLGLTQTDPKVLEMLIRQEELALARDKECNEHEFKMAGLRQETERLRLENERLFLDRERVGSPLVALHNEDYYKGPKVPKFKKGETEIEAYLRTVEKLAHVHKWTHDTWATRLAPLLYGCTGGSVRYLTCQRCLAW